MVTADVKMETTRTWWSRDITWGTGMVQPITRDPQYQGYNVCLNVVILYNAYP